MAKMDCELLVFEQKILNALILGQAPRVKFKCVVKRCIDTAPPTRLP